MYNGQYSHTRIKKVYVEEFTKHLPSIDKDTSVTSLDMNRYYLFIYIFIYQYSFVSNIRFHLTNLTWLIYP